MPSAPIAPATLSSQLRRLGLTRSAQDLNDLLARAATARWTPIALLDALATAELEDRARRSLERRFKRARLGRFKPIVDFEWSWPKAIDRALVEQILTLDFLERPENLVLVGAQGLGKTMIAKNVVHQAILHGHSALFTTAADLLFQIVTKRYEQKALVLTTNLAFRDWQTIFPNASCAVGLIDRLTHHAAIVKITGESYRLREAEQAQKSRRPS